jgi:polyvinyl alcohol dehydrogenase (cytochrome)
VALADWPFYGHDLSNSRNAGTDGPPAEAVASMERAWTFSTPEGDFTGTPAVANGVVVVGNHGGMAYGLDAVSGEVRWSRDLGAPINASAAIDVHAPGGPTAYVPVAEPSRPRLVALSLADGTPRWETVLTEQENASVYGSPVFWRGSLYIGTSGPNNDDTRARGSVVAIAQATGAKRWQTFTVPPGADGAAVWTTPAIDRATGRLYVGTGNNYHPPETELSDAIIAFDTATGAIVDHYQATPGDDWAPDNLTGGPDADFGSSPNLFIGPDGRRLVGEGQKSGVYWAFDRATLEPVWSTTVGPGGLLGGILGSTAVDDGRIYGADTIDGQVFALGHDGAMQWESPDAGGLHVSATTIANGVLYTPDASGFLNARDPETGAVLAKLPLDGAALGGVSADGGAVFVSVGTGPLPEPGPQTSNPGSIVAFGDTSTAGATAQPGQGARKPRLRLRVRPRRVRAQQRVRLRFRATRGRGTAARPVRRAVVRVRGRRVRTKRNGRASVRVRFRRSGRRVVRARHKGMKPARVTIRVLRAKREER